MKKRMIGRRGMAYGHRRGGHGMHGRPYGPPVPPPFLALALLAAFALGRVSGMKRRFGGARGPQGRGCAGPSQRAGDHGPHRGEEPPVIV